MTSTRDSTVSIACSVSREYLIPLAVVLHSLAERLPRGTAAKLYLIHEDLPREKIDLIGSIIDTEAIVPTPEQIAAAPHQGRFPRQAAYPILLPELLPRVDRVLFLDVDVLVLDDVSKLWQTDLEDRVFGAAPDAAVSTCSAVRGVKGWRELGIPEDAIYFNCGVLLIDLPRWREREITPRIHAYLRKTEQVDFLHQEAVNAVAWNDWQPVDRRWNLLASLDGRSHQSPARAEWRDPGIVHFAGRIKPWRSPVGGPFNAPYQKVLDRVVRTLSHEPPGIRDRMLSWYDRHARSTLYPIERALWERRLF
jgi:lipopolysaccharide biosynthesis glycosyltransferase